MKLFFTLLFLFFSLIVRAQDEPLTKKETKARNLIARLPEVAQFNKDMLRKITRPLIITVDNDPTSEDPYYTIAVAENFGNRAFTYWRFCVNGKTNAIYYLHTIEGKKETLAAWRKHNHKW
jgi:hypothetical protein